MLEVPHYPSAPYKKNVRWTFPKSGHKSFAVLLQLDSVNRTFLYNWRLLAVDGVAVTRDDLLGFLPLGTKLSSVAASSASSNVLSAKEACDGTINY